MIRNIKEFIVKAGIKTKDVAVSAWGATRDFVSHNRKKVIQGVTSFALIGAIGVGVGTNFFRGWTPEPGDDTVYSGLVADILGMKGMTLDMVKASAAEDTVTVTATIDATGSGYDDGLTWTTSFANASSSWASGKKVSDYVTMTVAEDTHSITLNCTQAFGEAIIVTATSDDYTDVTASCQLDYVKRISAVNVSLESIGLGQQTSFTGTYTLGTGTLTPTVTVDSMEVTDAAGEMNDALVDAITSSTINMSKNLITTSNKSVNGTSFSGTFSVNAANAFTTALTTDQNRRFVNLMIEEQFIDKLTFTVDLIAKYGDLTYGTKTSSVAYNVNYTGLSANKVNGVELDKDNIIF